MKTICINPVFMALKGNYKAQDEHGHSETLRFRETSWGTKSFGLGTGKQRDLTLNPLSADETAVRSAFTAAAAKRKAILASSSLRTTWLQKFKADRQAGLTTCNTLNGYIMSMGIHGQISDDNTPVIDGD